MGTPDTSCRCQATPSRFRVRVTSIRTISWRTTPPAISSSGCQNTKSSNTRFVRASAFSSFLEDPARVAQVMSLYAPKRASLAIIRAAASRKAHDARWLEVFGRRGKKWYLGRWTTRVPNVQEAGGCLAGREQTCCSEVRTPLPFNSRLWIGFHNNKQRSSPMISRTHTQRHKAKHLSSLPHASQPSFELSTLKLRSCCIATCCEERSFTVGFLTSIMLYHSVSNLCLVSSFCLLLFCVDSFLSRPFFLNSNNSAFKFQRRQGAHEAVYNLQQLSNGKSTKTAIHSCRRRQSPTIHQSSARTGFTSTSVLL